MQSRRSDSSAGDPAAARCATETLLQPAKALLVGLIVIVRHCVKDQHACSAEHLTRSSGYRPHHSQRRTGMHAGHLMHELCICQAVVGTHCNQL